MARDLNQHYQQNTIRNRVFDEDGNFIYVSDISRDISAGRVADLAKVDKFGETGDGILSADGLVTVWDGVNDASADKVYTYTATASIDKLSSSDDTDTQTIEITGQGTDNVEVVQTVTLTGQTKATLGTPLMRVYRMKNTGATTLAGSVYCYEDGTISGGVPTTDATIKALITPPNNQTLMAIYTIPAGCTGYIHGYNVDITSRVAGFIHGHLFIREPGGVFQTKRTFTLSTTGTSNVFIPFYRPQKVLEKSDIEFMVESTANSMGCGVNFPIDLETN